MFISELLSRYMKDTSDAQKLLSELNPPPQNVDAELCHRATLIFRYNSFGHTSALKISWGGLFDIFSEDQAGLAI